MKPNQVEDIQICATHDHQFFDRLIDPVDDLHHGGFRLNSRRPATPQSDIGRGYCGEKPLKDMQITELTVKGLRIVWSPRMRDCGRLQGTAS